MSSISNINAGHPHVQPVAAITPTQQVVEDANRIEYATDSLGRSLGVTRISSKLRRRVLKAVSAEQAEKSEYVNTAMVVCACVSIDGAPVRFPTTELQIDAQWDILDTEGIFAVSSCIREKFSTPQKDDLKN